MGRIVDSFLAEMDQEAQTTRRVLDRVPEEKLDWQPHAKSMTLGKLALHVATIPGNIAQALVKDTFEVGSFDQATAVNSKAELISALEESLKTAKQALGSFDDQKAMAIWKLTAGGKELMALPRAVVIRSVLLNHWYHHRGQLTVYLRLLNVPVPSIYGPSADENPFAGH